MISPQELAQIAQLLHSLMHSQVGGSSLTSRPAALSPLAAPHGTVSPGPRALLPTRTRSANPSPSGRATTYDRETRTLPRIESQPGSASSAYMSMARAIPSTRKAMGKMTWANTVRPGAGNFGMK